jgi:indole-3-glycerol phosphate synthase
LQEYTFKDYFDLIRAYRRSTLAQSKEQMPLDALRSKILLRDRPIDPYLSLRTDRLTLVAQIMRAVPGEGFLRRGAYTPVEYALRIRDAGASVFMVMTEERFHLGSLGDLTYVKQALNLPVIRQDYLFDRYHLFESCAAGADGVVIIPELLYDDAVYEFISQTQRLRMMAVVRVQNLDELERCTAWEPRAVVLANRDLFGGEVDLGVTERLCPHVPSHIITISQGGIDTADDVKRMRDAGVDAVAIGHALIAKDDPAAAVEQLFSRVW